MNLLTAAGASFVKHKCEGCETTECWDFVHVC